MLGPSAAFLIAMVRAAIPDESRAAVATPLLFMAVLAGAALAGRWSALSTMAIATLALLLSPGLTDPVATVVAIIALVGAALVTGELRDRAARAERATDVATARLKRVSLRDPLTGMLDRRGFEVAIGVEIAREARRGGAMTVLLVKLAGTSVANERYGHTIGDTLIQVFADAIERRIRQSDVAARIGDDEIAVLLPDTDAQGADVIATHIVARFRRDLSDTEPRLDASLTYGFAVFPSDGKGMDELLATADRIRRERVNELTASS